MNLLMETISVLASKGYTSRDVAVVTTTVGDHHCTWDEFADLANVEYNNGYGGPEVRTDLIVLMKDGTWFERGEYDGAEWWEYKKTPTVSDLASTLTWVMVNDCHEEDRK